MALFSSLTGALSSKATVTVGAAVLMVGGGVAIAQGGMSTGQNPPGHDVATEAIIAANDVVEDFEALCAEGSEWEAAAFCRGESYHPPGLVDREPDEDPDDPEENGGADQADAQDFSAWVRSLPSEWGCIRGALVSQAAQAGPTEFSLAEAPFDPTVDEVPIEDAAEAAGFEEPWPRCVEVAIARSNGEQPGPPDHAGRPDNAGPPAGVGNGNGGDAADGNENGDDVAPRSEGRGNGGPPDHAANRGNGGPPDHAANRGNGNGPENAPGRGN